MIQFNLPFKIKEICLKLKSAGFEAYVVGGTIRDIIINREISDFDITTNAFPDEIKSVFPNAKHYGDFGTMLIVEDGIKVEITPYRNDAPGRKPNYTFGGTIYTDLSRRDFTINSIAYDPIEDKLIDPFGGIDDIEKRVIRCTGSTRRIWEDPLRAMRAARFQAQLGFSIEASTLYALKAQSCELATVSWERIRDELSKILTADYNFEGLITLVITDLMNYIIPELMAGMGVMHSNKPVDVLEHNLIACKIIRNTLSLRLAALLHDIAKPATAVNGEDGIKFPKHQIKSAAVAKKILQRLRFDNKTIKKVVLLIENHMFYYTKDSSLADARRLVSKVGWENIYDLIDLRVADKIASGFDTIYSPGLKKLIMDLEVIKEENSDYQIKDLAVTGKDIMTELKMPAGPQIGEILNFLLDKVLEDPSLNNRDTLLELAKTYAAAKS